VPVDLDSNGEDKTVEERAIAKRSFIRTSTKALSEG